MKRRLALNTASNVGTLFLKLGITFIMTPILVSNLGRYDYGLWEMVGAVIGYMGILDMGIRPTVSRFASRSVAQGGTDQLTCLYATAWFYLMGVGIAIGSALAIWGLGFPETLAEPGSDTGKYTYLLLIIALQLMLIFPAYTAESFMEAYQEYYLKNNITIINSILGSVAIYSFISPSNALVLLAGINAVGVVTKYGYYVFYMQRKRSFLRPYPKHFSLANLKELFRFSIKTVVQGVSSRIENSTDSLVIGFIMGPASVPLYSIPANLVNYIRSIASNLTHVFMPYFSSLAATNETEKSLRIYLFGSKLTLAVVSIMSIGAVTLGENFLKLWIGEDIADGAAPILWILVAFTSLPLLNPYSARYLTAINRHGVFAKWGPVVALCNLGLSLWLIKPFGIYGVAMGSLLPALIYQPYILHFCCRELGIRVSHYLAKVILPLVAPCAVMGAILVGIKSSVTIDSYGVLLSSAIIASLAFCAVAFLTALNGAERKELLSLVRRSNH